MPELRSYPKVYNLGHPVIRELFDGPVVIQEKIDGSQFSFGVIDGTLHCRSRGAPIPFPCNDALFKAAVETAQRLHSEGKLVEGWIYRGEAVAKPKHNTIEYGRVPTGGLILFDVDRGLEDRVDYVTLSNIASELGLEHVPFLGEVFVTDPNQLGDLLSRPSILGGPIEGVVIKNYSRFNDKDGKMLMGKHVSEEFKETHRVDWKSRNPNRADVVERIVAMLSSPARYEKATQHIREQLVNEPKDIGLLMQEVHRDVEEECEDLIKQELYAHFRKQILQGVAKGLPQWYKDRLMQEQFKEETNE